MAVAKVAKEALWLVGLVKELDIQQGGVQLHCDNQSVIFLAKNQVYHATTKHINVRFHNIKELVSRPKTHSKGVTVISHFKPEGLQCNLTQILILLSEVTNYQVPVQSSETNLKSSIFNLKTKTSTIQNPLSK